MFMFFITMGPSNIYGCFHFAQPITALHFDSRSSTILIGLSHGNVCYVSLDMAHKRSLHYGYKDSVTALCSLLEGTVVGYADGVLVMEISGHKQELAHCHSGKISSIVAAHNFFVVGSSDKSISLWHINGLFSSQLNVGSEVTTLAVDNSGQLVLIGCQDGKLYILDCMTLDVKLFALPITEMITSLSLNNNLLCVGTSDAVILYSRIQNNFKILATSSPVRSIAIHDDNKTVVALCSAGDMYVWDEPLGLEIEHYCYMDSAVSPCVEGAVLCNDTIVAIVNRFLYVYTVPKRPVRELFLMSDLMSDDFGYVSIMDCCGYVIGVCHVGLGVSTSKMRLVPRDRNGNKENFLIVQKKDSTSAIYQLKYPLRDVKKILVTRSLSTGALCILYKAKLKSVPTSACARPPIQWHMARLIASSADICPCIVSAINVVLYSLNVAIRSVFLEKQERLLVQGVNPERQGAVWRFQDESQRCQGSCNLTVLTDAARYTWYIHHLTEQSEFFLSELVPSLTNESFWKKIKQSDASFNVDNDGARTALINSLRENGAFLKLSHYVEHVNQVCDVPLVSVRPLAV